MKDYRRNIRFSMRFQYGYYQFLDHFLGRDRSFKLHEKGRKKFFKKLHEQLKKSGDGTITPVDRVKDISFEEFRNKYQKKGIPVILEGAAKDWSCVKEWSLEYFKKLHGDDEIVMVDQARMGDGEKGDGEFVDQLTLAEVIDGIQKGKGKYYRFYPLLERHPEHLKDFDYKWIRERRDRRTWFEAFQVFIGGDNSETPLHNANQSNLFVQTYGEKKWMLYPNYYSSVIDPSPIRNVYRGAPYKLESGPFDPFDPSFETPYTLFKYIDGYSVHLKPGDILWNPPYWWHAVQNIGDSIGVGYRWLAPWQAFKMSPLYFFLDLCATNPPIRKAYKLYQKDINLIHLAEYDKLDEYLASKEKEKLALD